MENEQDLLQGIMNRLRGLSPESFRQEAYSSYIVYSATVDGRYLVAVEQCDSAFSIPFAFSKNYDIRVKDSSDNTQVFLRDSDYKGGRKQMRALFREIDGKYREWQAKEWEARREGILKGVALSD